MALIQLDTFLLWAQMDHTASTSVDQQKGLEHLVGMCLTALTQAQYDWWLDKFEHWHTLLGSSSTQALSEVVLYMAQQYLGGQDGKADMVCMAIASQYDQFANNKCLQESVKALRLHGSNERNIFFTNREDADLMSAHSFLFVIDQNSLQVPWFS